jgi:arylsulfatase A-like enzyme
MTRPNVLLILTDQQRFDSLGCNGNPHARTPNLDALAACGTVFTRHIASNPVCMPSRAGLCTGLLPSGHGVWKNGTPLNRTGDFGPPGYCRVPGTRDCPVPVPETIADVFARAGYETAAFGKLHLTPNLADPAYGFGESWDLMDDGVISEWHGPYYGFRHVDITRGHGEAPCRSGPYADWLREQMPALDESVPGLPGGKGDLPVPGRHDTYASAVPSKLHNTRWLADRFTDYLHTRDGDGPFFCLVGFPDPHHPFTPPHDVMEMFKDSPVLEPGDIEGAWWRQNPFAADLGGYPCIEHLSAEQRRVIQRHYMAMVYTIDMAVGRMIDALQKNGLRENTIVVFTSDHGEYMGDHGLLYKSPTGVDSLLRVPFILHAPGVNLPKTVHAPMSNCDVVPTLACLCGIEPPANIDGIDMLPMLRDGRQHVAFAQCYDVDRTRNNTTLYTDRYRFTWYPGSRYAELYDHADDPGESGNVVERHPDLVNEFKRRIERQTLQSTNLIVHRLAPW